MLFLEHELIGEWGSLVRSMVGSEEASFHRIAALFESEISEGLHSGRIEYFTP